MRLISRILAGVLCAGLLFAAAPAAAAGCGSDPVSRSSDETVRPPAEARPGTACESAEYERREAASPEVQEFVGGEVVVGVSIGVILLVGLVVLIVILLRD